MRVVMGGDSMANCGHGASVAANRRTAVSNVITKTGRAIGVALDDGAEFHIKVVIGVADTRIQVSVFGYGG